MTDYSKNYESASKWLKAADLKGREHEVVIVDHGLFESGQDKKVGISFEGRDKGLLLNKTNYRKLVQSFGNDADDWIGKKIFIFAEWVDYQGQQVEGVRIRVPLPAAAQDDDDSEVPF